MIMNYFIDRSTREELLFLNEAEHKIIVNLLKRWWNYLSITIFNSILHYIQPDIPIQRQFKKLYQRNRPAFSVITIN